MFGDQDVLAVFHHEPLRFVVDQYIDALSAKPLHDQIGYFRVFADQDARGPLHLSDLTAEAGEGLGQFRTYRPAAQHQQPLRQFAQIPDIIRGEIVNIGQSRNRRDERATASGNDDAARGQGARTCGVGHFHSPGRNDFGGPLHHVHAQTGVTLHRIMRRDFLDHALDSLHHFGKIKLGGGLADAKFSGSADVRQQFGGADQRLGRDAAGVQAVAAHLMLFDQGDFGLDRGRDVGRHQSGGTGTDHHQIAIKTGRFAPFGIDPPPLQHRDDLVGDQRENPQQREGSQQFGRHDALERVNLRQLGAGVHINHGAGQHADLTDPIKGPGADRGQAHDQIDDEERKNRNQPQGEQIKTAFPLNPGVDGFQFVAEFALHPVTQHEARDQKSQGRAEGRGEGDQQRPPPQPEHRAARQGHDGGARQRQAGDGDVNQKENASGQRRLGAAIGFDNRLLAFNGVQTEEAAQIEDEESTDQGGERENQQKFAGIHGKSGSGLRFKGWFC